jgi:hypothetical protein
MGKPVVDFEIKNGMPKGEVLNQLGPPQSTAVLGAKEMMTWPGLKIVFIDSCLHSYSGKVPAQPHSEKLFHNPVAEADKTSGRAQNALIKIPKTKKHSPLWSGMTLEEIIRIYGSPKALGQLGSKTVALWPTIEVTLVSERLVSYRRFDPKKKLELEKSRMLANQERAKKAASVELERQKEQVKINQKAQSKKAVNERNIQSKMLILDSRFMAERDRNSPIDTLGRLGREHRKLDHLVDEEGKPLIRNSEDLKSYRWYLDRKRRSTISTSSFHNQLALATSSRVYHNGHPIKGKSDDILTPHVNEGVIGHYDDPRTPHVNELLIGRFDDPSTTFINEGIIGRGSDPNDIPQAFSDDLQTIGINESMLRY